MKDILILTLFTPFLINCAIDIRQLPSPKEINQTLQDKNRKTLNIGEFKILNDDLIEIESAWRYIFISFLNDDISIKNKYTITENNQNNDAFKIDIRIKPILIEKRNYWWSLPIIYPATLIWPIHLRKLEYNISVEYSISKNGIVIITETFDINNEETIFFYGLTRTFVFEEFIENTNKKVLDKCVAKISLQLFQF